MANSETGGADLREHNSSYVKFLGWLKFGSIITAIVTAIVIFAITR